MEENQVELPPVAEANGHHSDDEIINELPAEVYNQTLRKIVEDNLKTPFDECDVVIVPGSAKGDNYIGVLYRVTVTSSDGRKLNLIVKLPPQNEVRREQFFAKECFLRESEFYDNVYPMYKKFQEEKGIDIVNEGFSKVPRVYASLIEAPFEGLFFEDLKALDFDMHDRLKDVRIEHVELLMKNLGKLHAIAFSIKDQKPELMKEYKEIRDIFLMRNSEKEMAAMNGWFTSLKGQVLGSLEGLDDPELTKKVGEFFEDNFHEMLAKGIDKESAEPYAILNHGDCWNNNLMYRNDKDGIPNDIRLLDFQLMRYCSPVCDLLYYIFCCTTKEFRDKHYSEVLDLYYQSLTSFMERLGSDPKKVFPREAFEAHLKRFGRFGLTMASMVLPIFVSSAEDIPDMDEIALKVKEAEDNGTELDPSLMDMSKKKSAGKYNDRMRGVLVDMKRLGYI